jgi:hypothetical protein
LSRSQKQLETFRKIKVNQLQITAVTKPAKKVPVGQNADFATTAKSQVEKKKDVRPAITVKSPPKQPKEMKASFKPLM